MRLWNEDVRQDVASSLYVHSASHVIRTEGRLVDVVRRFGTRPAHSIAERYVPRFNIVPRARPEAHGSARLPRKVR
jgi:hypothetical protein